MTVMMQVIDFDNFVMVCFVFCDYQHSLKQMWVVMNYVPVIVMVKDESNGDPAKPESKGGEGEKPDVAHLKQIAVNKQTDRQTNK